MLLLYHQRFTFAIGRFKFSCIPLFCLLGRDLISIAPYLDVIMLLCTVRRFQYNLCLTRFAHLGMYHIGFDRVFIADRQRAKGGIDKARLIGIVERRALLIAAVQDIRVVDGRIDDRPDRQRNDHHRADDHARDTDALLTEDGDGIDQHGRRAEDRAVQMARERKERLPEITPVVEREQHQHRRKDQQSPPLILLHIIADKAHREGQDRPEDPVAVIAHDRPAEERHLDQIDQRLADQKEHKAFQRGIEIAFCVHDDQDAAQHPAVKIDRGVGQRGIVQKRHLIDQPRIHTRDHREQNQLPPCQVQPAKQFFKHFHQITRISLRFWFLDYDSTIMFGELQDGKDIYTK